jgi:hypothetical protein
MAKVGQTTAVHGVDVGVWQRRTLKAAVEAEMGVAIDTLLSSSSVIIVGWVFT